MKNIVLDFGTMDSPKAVHDFLREATGSEEYFGSNLDAMFDVLTTIGEETCITVIRGGKDFEEKFIAVMKDAAEEQRRLTVQEGEQVRAAQQEAKPVRKIPEAIRLFKESRRQRRRKKG